ncbi:MAG: two pore domain potassium channel family protein [Halioglobus sp.]|nr:two pore domain potassium channel family protein [Halioglobus sp.]
MARIHSHNNFFVFTAALIVLLLCSAVVSSLPEGSHHRLLQAVLILSQLVAYFSLNLSRQWRRFVLIMLLGMLLANGLREFSDGAMASLSSLFVYMLFLLGMIWAGARQALLATGIEANTIAGAVAVYLLLGLLWTTLYLLTLEVWPQAFHGIDYRNWNDNFGQLAYFSFITMTTVGYGDISPGIPITRVLAYLQAIVGTFYMAVVVAGLIGALGRREP